jgi:hypothetical protein
VRFLDNQLAEDVRDIGTVHASMHEFRNGMQRKLHWFPEILPPHFIFSSEPLGLDREGQRADEMLRDLRSPLLLVDDRRKHRGRPRPVVGVEREDALPGGEIERGPERAAGTWGAAAVPGGAARTPRRSRGRNARRCARTPTTRARAGRPPARARRGAGTARPIWPCRSETLTAISRFLSNA